MKIPYQIILLLALGFPFGIFSEQWSGTKGHRTDHVDAMMPEPTVSSCSINEAWGRSIYTLDGLRGIHHYVWHKTEDSPRYVRFIATDPNVTVCTVTERALIFVDPIRGIYQTDRAIEADGGQLWIAPTPLNFNAESSFQEFNGELYLVSEMTRVFIQVDRSVRNDHVAGVTPTAEISVSAGADLLSAPFWFAPGIFAVSDGSHMYQLRLDNLETIPVPNFPPGTLFAPGIKASSRPGGIKLESTVNSGAAKQVVWLANNSEEVASKQDASEKETAEINGFVAIDSSGADFCLGGNTSLVSFDRSGMLKRYRLNLEQGTAALEGSFKLSSTVSDCLIDMKLQRLYVVERLVGVWVFDLRGIHLGGSDLPLPRAVTTDSMIESLGGLALYENKKYENKKYENKKYENKDYENKEYENKEYEIEEHGFVVTQSIGDGAFLLFDRLSMTLLGRFKVTADIVAGLDGVHATRGFVASSRAYPGYPLGLLLVQDQRNRLPEAAENLKIVDWRDILRVVELAKEKEL